MGQTTGIKRVLEGDLLRLEDRVHTLDNEQSHDPEALRRLLEVREEYAVALGKLRCHDHAGYICRVTRRKVRLDGCWPGWFALTHRGP
ncbi:hypothetical protein NDU88_003295 [Pleurodeles waltl]|uniref:Uncharacterized protein n=1 Tax=Pleurodeles waltl TaxID=8319 RepID=A0AAV7TPB8_PLEWA|nr:hypothetical protein NDU88_003295 [Pleurodeles waltl]